MGFLNDASISELVGFIASMLAIGGMVSGTVAWVLRLRGRALSVPDWTVYGGLIGGWFTLLAITVGALVSWVR